MALETTVGQILVNDVLPEELRDYSRVLDKSALNSLLKEVARKHPEKYRDVSFQLSQIGRHSAQEQGGLSFGARHLRKSKVAAAIQDKIKGELYGILADDNLTDKQRNDKIVRVVGRESSAQQRAVLDEAVKENNPLGLQVLSGSRGKPMNLASLLAADMLYSDHRDEVIPVPVLRSYSQGLTPAEYWAGTYGARRGIIATKFATQEAGFLSKQLNQAGHRLVVVDEEGEDENPGLRGLIVDTEDMDNEGSLLAQDTGPFRRNTPLTPKILKQLKRLGKNRILVRSPLIGGSPEGGVYARDVGVREKGLLPGRGEQVGLQAAQALSEPISQGQLCLAEKTLVRMADCSVKPIEEIVPGDYVFGSDTNGNLRPVKVLNVYNNGLKDCVETVFNVSRTKESVSLISTREHKILAVARRWAPTTEIAEKGIWAADEKCVRLCGVMPNSVAHQFIGKKHEAMSLLLGLLLGDGCYTVSVHGVHLSCFDPSLIADIQPLLTSLGLKATLLAGQKGYYRISQIVDTVNQCPTTGRLLSGDRNPVLVKLKELKFYGKYAYEKTVPADIWEWDSRSTLNLLGGLFASDGSIYLSQSRRKHKAYYVSYSSTSLQLITAIRDILRVRFAIHSGPIDLQSKNRKRILYSFVICRQQEVDKFIKLMLDFIPGCKNETLKKAGNFNSSVNTCFFYRKKQTIVGQLRTYDIEVDHPDHLFVLANGLIVSNSAKHSGGVAGQEKAVGGFQYINQLIQTPKKMQGGAAHATVDGTVQRIEPAPAGGSYITIGGERHYVNAGYDLKVKKGDTIEAGDMLSDGIPNPATITKYKGVGEGRRYFVQEFKKAMASSGMFGHRRNIELLARGLINHVRLTEEVGDNVQDDVIPYTTLEHTYKPRDGFQALSPKKAVGKYLERPVLHYTIGTKVRPSMLKDFDEFGVQALEVHDNPPPFESHMVRGMYQLQHDPDWLTQMYGSGLKESLLESTARGATSEERGSSFVPSLVTGTDFGDVSNRVVIQPKAPYKLPDVPIPDIPEPKDSLVSAKPITSRLL